MKKSLLPSLAFCLLPLAVLGQANEPEAPASNDAAKPKDSEIVPTPPADWKQFKHVTGSSFYHPSDWSVQDNGNALQLVPANTRFGKEMIYATGMPAPGIDSAADPQVVAYLDAAMLQLNPTARRSDPPAEKPTASGMGSVYHYTAVDPYTGAPLEARVYIIVKNGISVSFSLVGDATSIHQRSDTLDRIFASYAMDAPEVADSANQPSSDGTDAAANIDAQLLGYWYGEAVSRPMEGTMVNSRFTYYLAEDGTLFMGSNSAVGVALQDSSGVYNQGSASGLQDNVQRGHWSARNGVLSIRWQDSSSSTTRYRVNGRTLEIRDFQGKLINFYER